MGFYGLLPALKPTARYNTTTRTLILTASGKAEEATSSIGFTQQNFPGGLKFDFGGWTGPVTGKYFEYTRTSVFSIELPNPVTPSDTVIIVSSTDREGTVIPIEFVDSTITIPGLSPLESEAVISADKKLFRVKPFHPGSTITGEDINLTALFRTPFSIAASSQVTKRGGVAIKFDPNFLTLISSGITDKDDVDIEWEFDSLQTGDTQVILTRSFGISTIADQRTIYNVKIIALSSEESDSDSPTTEVTRDLKSAALAKDDFVSHSWLSRVNSGYGLILKAYPGAQLYNVLATPLRHGGVPYPLELIQLVIMARLADNQGMASIRSIGWSQFGPIVKSPLIVGNANVPWPVKMEITQAWGLVLAAGYSGLIEKCQLKKVLSPNVDEAMYVFNLVGGEVVTVGVDTGSINGKVAEE